VQDYEKETLVRIRGVVFDLDGTLLDTLEDIADAANAALAERRHPVHPVDAYRYFVGDGAPTLIHRILPESARTPEEEAVLLRRYKELYGTGWDRKTAPYPGIVEMLGALAARGLHLAVLSNKPQDATTSCVEGFFKGCAFAIVQGQTEEFPKKPDPAGANAIALRCGIGPAEWLYVGDTATDMQTAVGAGMFPVGALWGFRTADELAAHGARKLITHPSELITLLDDRTLQP
jgi:phosphoglycolate phosphatase